MQRLLVPLRTPFCDALQYNLLDSKLPEPESNVLAVVRNGAIGFSAAAAAAIASNWARVIKTFKQTHANARVTYAQARCHTRTD
jgi:hypothetical protein